MSDEHKTSATGGLKTFETAMRDAYSLYFNEYGDRIAAGEVAKANPAEGEVPDFPRFFAHGIESTISSPAAAYRTSQAVYGISTWLAKALATIAPATIKNVARNTRDQFSNIKALAGPLLKALADSITKEGK